MRTTIEWLTTAFDRVVGFVPNLIAGLVILLLGWIIALALSRLTRALAHKVGFDRLVSRLGAGTTGEPSGASRWLGSAVYVIVMLVAVMQASRAWRLDFIANGLAAVIGYLPHAIAAAVVFGAALLIGNWVRDRVFRPRAVSTTAGAEVGMGAGTESPRVLPSLVRGAIIAVGAFMALRELQIAPEIVNLAFMLTLGAIAVAGALAFGLGARDVAGRVAHWWWERRSFLGPTTPTPGAPPPRVGVCA